MRVEALVISTKLYYTIIFIEQESSNNVVIQVGNYGSSALRSPILYQVL